MGRMSSMKVTIIASLLMSVVILGGCGSAGGVSQEEYDALKAQLDAVQSAEDESVVETEVVSETPAPVDKKEGNSVTLKQDTAEAEVPDEETKEVELLNSWYTTYKREGSNYSQINYVVEVKNPNETYDVIFPHIEFVAKSADGSMLASKELTLNSISAGDTILYGNNQQYDGELPETVEITVSSKDEYCREHDPEKYVKQEAFTFSNLTEQGERNKKITGEITNNSDVGFDTVAVSVLYSKGGQYIGGNTGYVNDVGAGETKVFEIPGSSYIEDYDSIDVYAIQW